MDSPGGAVGTQEIYEEIIRIDQKSSYASFGSVAADGGYYIGAARKIFANKGTITGSIGVMLWTLK